ncbi:hypothetical protein LPJ68_001273 [Coemansia sp. RSA 1086]|nr:hypothetical protein LPJ68_001273 [Coemansia sp. RSA 1086]
MTNVLISGTYPDRQQEEVKQQQATEALVTSVSTCPLHAPPTTSQHVLKYSLTREDESMREALKLLNPTKDNFRTGDYKECFNWCDISHEFHKQLANFAHLPKRDSSDLSWYAVVFRSKRRADCSNADLFEADKQAYEEAFSATNGSLLVYWYTGLDDEHNCLATCVWSSRDIARSVNSLPRHREAARLSADVYVHYHIDRYRIEWVPNSQTLKVEPW